MVSSAQRRPFPALLGDFRVILAVYTVLTVAGTLQKFLLHNANNFFVFKYSFHHLLAGKDLYILHLQDHLDLYKYSPAFALLLAPVAVLPDWLGALVWNLLNLLPLLFALRWLDIDAGRKAVVMWVLVFELFLSLQNFQSNGLMAALLLLGFICLERGKPFLAALCIVFSFYIKLFGLAAVLLFALYPRRGRSALYVAFWLVFFAVLPLLVVPPRHLLFLYESWLRLLRWDSAVSIGLSVAGFCRVYLGLSLPNLPLQAIGGMLLALPLLRFSRYSDPRFRATLFCSILVWIIVFNHKAESPTFVIAMLGIALWYALPHEGRFRLVFLLVCLAGISLSSTDLLPRSWRDGFVDPWLIKALPAIAAWFILQGSLLFGRDNHPAAG